MPFRLGDGAAPLPRHERFEERRQPITDDYDTIALDERVPFTIVPHSFFRLKHVRPIERLIYLYLWHLASGTDSTTFPSYHDLADALEISRIAAIRGIARLIELGLIRKIPRKNPRGDAISNRYTVVHPAPIASSSKSSPHPERTETVYLDSSERQGPDDGYPRNPLSDLPKHS